MIENVIPGTPSFTPDIPIFSGDIPLFKEAANSKNKSNYSILKEIPLEAS